MSDPTTTNKLASTVNEILKGLIEGAGESAIETAAIASQPWLGLPIIKQLFSYAVGWIAKYFYQQAAITATKIIIDVQIKMETSQTYGAFQNLQMAIASGDQVAITKASEDLDKAYGSLIHYDGSASA